MTSEQVKELTGYLHRAINASVFGVPAEEVPQLHERVDSLLSHIETQEAEIARLRHRLQSIYRDTDDLIDDVIRPLGLAIYSSDTPFVAKGNPRGSLNASVKNMAAEIAKMREDVADLARIREILSMLGDGEPVELAKRAAKVIGKFAEESRCDHSICPDVAIDCTDCAIRAALDATKEESDE